MTVSCVSNMTTATSARAAPEKEKRPLVGRALSTGYAESFSAPPPAVKLARASLNGTPQSDPMNDGHERTLLSFMMRGERLDIQPNDFASPINRQISEAILAVPRPELLSVQDELRRRGHLKAVGSESRLTEIFSLGGGCIGRDSLEYALGEVLDASRRRQESKIGEELSQNRITGKEGAARLSQLAVRDSRSEFAVHTAAELLAMPVAENACLLGDRLLALGQALVIAGVGGIGKTRLLLQFFVALIIGRDWCGFPTHGRGKRCLFLQTENNLSRLQSDLSKLRDFAGNDWPLVEEKLLIHTVETDADLLLSLGDPQSAARLETAIRKYDPDVVGLDPLRDFAMGDLNSDADMSATLREAGRISRAGNPDRALVILHHALTGRAGASKAFGLERAGFARNSKMLQTWTRGLINIVPGSADDNETLVLTCGKNSNGREFAPVTVRLNPATMIYEVNEDFDIDSWRGQLASGKPERRCFDAGLIRDLDFPEAALPKKAVVKLIRDETGCGISRAYELVEEAVKRRILTLDRRTKTYAKA